MIDIIILSLLAVHLLMNVCILRELKKMKDE